LLIRTVAITILALLPAGKIVDLSGLPFRCARVLSRDLAAYDGDRPQRTQISLILRYRCQRNL